MGCRWGIFASFGLIVALPAAVHAQADVGVSASSGEAAAPASPQAITYGALPGGIHVSSAQTLPAGSAEVELLSGFGYRKGLLGSNERFGRGIGDVSAAYGVLDMLSVGLSLDGRYDRHYGLASGGNSGCGPTCDDGYVGDPHLYVRLAKAVGANSIGAQVGVWVPGNKAPSLKLSATSIDLLALGTLAVGPGRLSVNAGFRVDNSAKSVDSIMSLSMQDRVSLGVSNYNEALAGVQLVIPSGNKWFGVEGSLEAFLGSPPANMANLNEGSLLLRAGVTGGLQLTDQWGLVAYVEAAKVPGVQLSQVMANSIPIIPYEPIITGGIALQARFGGPGGGISHAQKACWETAEGCKPDERPLFGEVTGTVVDDAGKPVVGAKVSIEGHVYSAAGAPAVTDQNGAYHIKDVQIGRRVTTPSKAGPQTDEKVDETSIDVRVELADKKPGTATIDKPKLGENAVPPIKLEPALPPGQLKGIVRTQAGKAVGGATIIVSPGDKKTESAADGTFAIDLAPGQYKVTVKAPGLAPQELDVTIDPNGVNLKEFLLHK
jgi:hypothetical protein